MNLETSESIESGIYIFTVGYEERSYHILDKLKSKLNFSNSIIFIINDFSSDSRVQSKVDEIIKLKLNIKFIDSDDFHSLSKHILKFISDNLIKDDRLNVHLDYTSMPKNWFCRLPQVIGDIVSEDDRIFYWYSEGKYTDSYEKYPSAGIESFIHFSGKPSLVIDKKRTHIIALGFDIKRSTAITTIIDPEDVINCYSFNPERIGFEESLKGINKPLLSQASLVIGFDISDFKFMFSKINETVNELLPNEVIIIPDGPKPLIMAMSLVASYKEKKGVTCLHVSNNPRLFKSNDVTATGNVFGVRISV